MRVAAALHPHTHTRRRPRPLFLFCCWARDRACPPPMSWLSKRSAAAVRPLPCLFFARGCPRAPAAPLPSCTCTHAHTSVPHHHHPIFDGALPHAARLHPTHTPPPALRPPCAIVVPRKWPMSAPPTCARARVRCVCAFPQGPPPSSRHHHHDNAPTTMRHTINESHESRAIVTPPHTLAPCTPAS